MRIKSDIEGFSMDRKGITGVGALIAFASMVLIATIAAVILINSGLAIQRYADRTVKQTGAEISTGVDVVSVIGEVGSEVVEGVKVIIKKMPGSPDIDLRGMTVLYVSDDESKYLKFGGMGAENASHENFGVIMINNLDKGENYMLTSSGDVIEIVINAGEIELDGGLEVSDTIEIELMPKIGFKTTYRTRIYSDIAGKRVALL